jgi:uncharacterized protein YcbK (DUF882 family)
MNDWPYRFFTPDELRCKHTDRLEMNVRFMDRLEKLRVVYGRPMPVSSGYRDASHPSEAKKEKPGTGFHCQGRAVDIAVTGADAIDLIRLATDMGFKGIGVQQKGAGRFIHLDDREDPAIWSY